MTTLITKTTSPFCHEWQRVRVSSRHLVIVGWACIAIILIIKGSSIIIISITLIRKGHKSGRHGITTHLNLTSSNAAYMGVHLTQLITESVEASIHVLKLHHDVLECHSTHRRGGNGCGWSWKSGRSYRTGPPRSKLHLVLFNGSVVNGTHNGEVVEKGKRNRKWHKIHVIAEGKMSLSQVVISLYTSIIERIKCERKSKWGALTKKAKIEHEALW